MNPPLAAALGSWSFDPTVMIGLLVVAGLYLRGFRSLAAVHPERFPRWRRAAFLAGLAVFLVAVASPIDAFAELLLQVHMAQHLLLMMVAPPLVWLGAPVNPILHGLPRAFLSSGLGPFLSWPALKSAAAFLVHPVTAWLTFAAMVWLWHAPALYEAALRDPFWHEVEHAGFFGAALLFWFPVVQPWPSHPVWPRAAMLPYLALAGVQTTVFSAVFAFSERVFYPSYAALPRLFGMSAIADQQAAGAVMWVPGSIVLLVAVSAIALDALDTPIPRARTRRRAPGPPSRSRLDVLRLRWLGPALRSLRVRRSLQGLMLGLAALIVVDGLFGAQEISALNLAGVLPWTYWRGFVVIGLLVLGNVFCAVCPFTLSRSLAGRLLGHRLRWPRVLANKWTAVGLFVAYLWAYEAFALWDSPFWTAWIVLGYFVSCFLIEGLFPRGSFCRHVCPIGQFQFVGAGVSPLEVRRIDPSVCGSCRTHDCLRGNDESPGCPTGLFLPTKQASLDCTFCLDCVRACPHDNAGLVAVNPGAALGTDRAPTVDVAALILVFCFGAFTNAAAMIAPVSAWERTLGAWLGSETRFVPLALGLGFGLVAAPAAAALVCGWIARVLGSVDLPVRVLVARLAPALVPVGFAMWLAHFGFHLVTGLGTLGPAAARAASGAGLAVAHGTRMLGMAMGPVSGTLEGLQIVVLGAGLVVSVAAAWRLSLDLAPRPQYAFGVAAPWALLATALYGAGVWILLQPMEMRGMVMS